MFMLTKFKHYGWDICVFLAIFISMFIFFTGVNCRMKLNTKTK